jgi:hypothetical protein
MGGGYVNSWEEHGFVWVATAPNGRNEYAVVLHSSDAVRLAERIMRSVGLAGGAEPAHVLPVTTPTSP